MATQTDELQGVDEMLDALTPKHDGSVAEQTRDGLDLLRMGFTEISGLTQIKEFPEFFHRLAGRTGLRLVLFKRWTSGLQVFLEKNIQLPAEAKKKRPDGRAPIPSTDEDVFHALSKDPTVYAGPVPEKHFPLDLTLMLGRGSRDRRIIILPLPSQSHWNTFLYLDADQDTENVLAAAEILARYALARMSLLNKGIGYRKGAAEQILKTELHRRRTDLEKKARSDPGLPGDGAADPAEADPQAGDQSAAGTVAAASDESATTAEREGRTGDLTPASILNHSGELPALPKAACHIMAVIEDPGTTAPKLEQALAMDQALTAKVLRIANSPFYGAVREIDTVSEAIVRLGFVAIRNWTLVTAARSVFLSPGAGMLYQKIWRQSVMSAMAGQLVAQALGGSNPDSVFIGGLMQNIGQLVLARSHPELFQEIVNESSAQGMPYHVVERQRLGFDHGELGALLIKEWNLSPELEEAVRWHHGFQQAEATNNRIAAMIALGEEVALTSSGQVEEIEGEEQPPVEEFVEPKESPSQAAEFLQVTPEVLAELRTRAAELKIDPHFFS
ncbi:MAG: HDOD domain-containing protein [Candidatus Krumholzibacteriota bacterium]